MKKLQDYKFWFIVGSQFLYGPEAKLLKTTLEKWSTGSTLLANCLQKSNLKL